MPKRNSLHGFNYGSKIKLGRHVLVFAPMHHGVLTGTCLSLHRRTTEYWQARVCLCTDAPRSTDRHVFVFAPTHHGVLTGTCLSWHRCIAVYWQARVFLCTDASRRTDRHVFVFAPMHRGVLTSCFVLLACRSEFGQFLERYWQN
jgi:hypothetical protein